AGFAGASRSPARSRPAAHVVSAPRTRSALAKDQRPVPHPRVRNHAAADAGRSRAAEVRGMARQVPVARGAGHGTRTGSDEHVVPAWLQRQTEALADDRARIGCPLSLTVAS